MSIESFIRYASAVLDKRFEEIEPHDCPGLEMIELLWPIFGQMIGPDHAGVQAITADERFALGLDRKLIQWALKGRITLPPMLPGERRLLQERIRRFMAEVTVKEAENMNVLCPPPELRGDQLTIGALILHIEGMTIDQP